VKPLSIDPVHRVEVALVDELDLRLDHPVERGARGLENCLHVVDRLVELSVEAALDEVTSLRVAPDLGGDVNQPAVLPRMHVRATRLGGFLDRDRRVWAHCHLLLVGGLRDSRT
jgi:hypothetical protein